ncbi:hypothetical protein RB195_004653 [Necator americanus]|uniref:Reverse transcriptase/retrotransposon-derived protein RNase H-like domain-containing protein n=1 Tax=Necator americanus TaxID=51031 RepID=A0ABR1BMZ8_NECAM
MYVMGCAFFSHRSVPLKASLYESEVARISGGVFVYGIVDYGEEGDSVHFFLIAVKKRHYGYGFERSGAVLSTPSLFGAYFDDILVAGGAIGEHNARQEVVLKRIKDYGIRVRLDKCAFLQTEITYLEFVTNAQGRRPDPEKIKAIQKMPAPKDVSQLRSFLGLINFYGNFVKDLHNLRAPLDTLTKEDVVYTWTPECQSSFDKIKAVLSSDLLLTHFDPSLPIIVAADASNY